MEACRASPLRNRPSRQPPDTEASTGFPEKPSTHPYQDLHAVLSISASHRWHSQMSSTLFFYLKPTTILKVKGILPFLKGICGSTATTFKKTHVVIWTSPFLKAGLLASTLLLSKVFHVCMRLTSCETLFKSLLYLLASVQKCNWSLKEWIEPAVESSRIKFTKTLYLPLFSWTAHYISDLIKEAYPHSCLTKKLLCLKYL